MESFLRVFLPLYWLAFILTAWVLPLRWLRRTHGMEGEALAHPDPVMRLGETIRNGVFAVVLVLVALFAVHPPALQWMGVIPLLDHPLPRGAGVGIMLAGLLLVRAGQRALGASWRIGFDPHAPAPPLVVDGIYRVTRNPIYLGLALSAVGLLLALPNAVTAAVAPLAIALLQIRVRIEERWLQSVHGTIYWAFAERTPRWLFRRAPLPEPMPLPIDRQSPAAGAPRPSADG